MISLLLIFSLVNGCSRESLPETKYFIQDEININKNEIENVKKKLKEFIITEYNLDKNKPLINSITLFEDTQSKYGTKYIILTNFVNQRSQKYEFDGMKLYNFIQQNIKIPQRNIGGNKEDFLNERFKIISSENFAFLPIDKSWLIEDSSKVSLWHNDYELKETIDIIGFDSDGEPEIRISMDNSIMLVFNSMPPSNGKDTQGVLGDFEHFDRYLSEKLGVKVSWIDREFFEIKHPQKDTALRLKTLLDSYWTIK